jgi:hypothetical protein
MNWQSRSKIMFFPAAFVLSSVEFLATATFTQADFQMGLGAGNKSPEMKDAKLAVANQRRDI